jgi:hypothetical protein
MKDLGKKIYNGFLYTLAVVIVIILAILALPFAAAGAIFVAIFTLGSVICFIGLIALSAIFSKEK